MSSTLDKSNENGLLAVFKGDSGTGKTVAALSFPNVYMFDLDKKMPSIAQKHFPGKDITYDTFEDVFEIDKKLQELISYCPYETILADSFTALGNIAIHSVGKIKGEPIISTMSKGKSGTMQMLGIDYYAGEDRFLTYFTQQLKKLHSRPGNPRHVIMTAHVVTVESSPDLSTKIVTKTRSILSKGRKPGPWLPTEFDNVYTFGHRMPDMGEINRQVRRICLTESYDEDSAKCSFPFPAEIDFTNKSLYDELCKSYDLSAKSLCLYEK